MIFLQMEEILIYNRISIFSVWMNHCPQGCSLLPSSEKRSRPQDLWTYDSHLPQSSHTAPQPFQPFLLRMQVFGSWIVLCFQPQDLEQFRDERVFLKSTPCCLMAFTFGPSPQNRIDRALIPIQHTYWVDMHDCLFRFTFINHNDIQFFSLSTFPSIMRSSTYETSSIWLGFFRRCFCLLGFSFVNKRSKSIFF